MPTPPVRYALSADLVQSRRVRDRAGFAAALSKALKQLADRFAGDWFRPPVIARGIDEVSAALKRPDRIFDALVALNLAVWPQRFRLGVGTGVIDIGLRGDAADLDGPAFHRAAEAVRRAARDGIPFAIETDLAPAADLAVIESLALLHARATTAWKPRMHAAAVAYRALGTQAAAAKRLKTTQQSVSKSLERARHDELIHAEDSVRGWFSKL